MKALIKILFLYMLLTGECLTQWLPQNSGITGSIMKINFHTPEKGYAISGDKLLSTTDAGADWNSQTYSNSTYFYDIFFVDQDHGWLLYSDVVFFMGDNHSFRGVRCSSNGGMSWTGWSELSNGWPFYSIHFIDTSRGWAAGTVGQIFKTTNKGFQWTPQVSNTQSYLNSIFFIDSLNGWAAGDHTIDPQSWIVKTTDGGLNWIPQENVTPENLNAVFFTDINHGWIVGRNNAIFKTTNAGETWQFQAYGEEKINYSDVFFYDSLNGWIVGSNGIILNSTDGGLIWNKQESGTTNNLYSVSFINNQTGWISGSEGIILHTVNGGITSAEEEYILPSDYSLFQNYPDPFNSSTIIRYKVPSAGRVILKVYDPPGNETAILVNEDKSPGTYEFSWNAADLPSGVYFYQLRAGSFVETKKMVLLK